MRLPGRSLAGVLCLLAIPLVAAESSAAPVTGNATHFDGLAWCRDDLNHLDLSRPSLNRFVMDGVPVGDLSEHWSNRQVSWRFVPAPNYTEVPYTVTST